jgi:hypothetical protein
MPGGAEKSNSNVKPARYGAQQKFRYDSLYRNPNRDRDRNQRESKYFDPDSDSDFDFDYTDVP